MTYNLGQPLGAIRTVGRSEGPYDDQVINLSEELADSLEGSPYALFYTPDESITPEAILVIGSDFGQGSPAQPGRGPLPAP